MRPSRFWRLFLTLGLLGTGGFGPLLPATAQAVPGTPDAPDAPTVMAAPQATLPLNDVLRGEWAVSLGRMGDGGDYEPSIPYRDVISGPGGSWASGPPASYAANLRHTEDPRNGVTFNAVLTDPAGATHTYPCWYGQDFTTSPASDQDADHAAAPVGTVGVHLAFPCKILGAWAGHVTVTDAGGTVSGPAFSFTVAGALPYPLAAKGRITVSTTDPKSFQYDDGDKWLPVGETMGGAGAGDHGLPHLAAMRAGNAAGVIRWFGFALGGPFPLTGLAGGFDGNFTTAQAGVTAEDAHSGRYSYLVTSTGGSFGASSEFAYHKPLGQAEAYGVWVKAEGLPAGAKVGVTSYGGYSPCSPLVTLTGTGWQYVTGTVGANAAGGAAANNPVYLTVQNADGSANATGHALFDDLVVVEQSHAALLTGPSPAGPGSAWDLLGGRGTYDYQNTLDPQASAEADQFLRLGLPAGVGSEMELYDKGDFSQASIQSDGTPARGGSPLNTPVSQWVGNTNVGGVYANQNNQFGAYPSEPSGASDDGCGTAVGLMHYQQVRAWVAHFGCYVGTAVPLLPYGNEIEPGGAGSNEQFGVDHWAVQARMQASPASDCLPPCGVDTYFNATGLAYQPVLAESPYTQFYQQHIAATGYNGGTGTYAVPFNMAKNGWLQNGITRHATGGPFGRGYVQYAYGATPNPSLPGIQIPTVRRAGTYTLSGWVMTAPDAQGRPFAGVNTGDPFPSVRNTGIYVPSPSATDFISQLSLPVGGYPAWHRFSVSVPITSGLPWQAGQVDFWNTQTAGDVRYADLTLTGPNNRVFWRATFDEPDLDAGGGDAVAVWGVPYAATYSGEPGAGRPGQVGESEAYYPSPDAPPLGGDGTPNPLYSASGAHFFTIPGPTDTNGVRRTPSVAYPWPQYGLRAALSAVDARWLMDTWWTEESISADRSGAMTAWGNVQAITYGLRLADGTWGEVGSSQSGFLGPSEPLLVYGQANDRDAATGAVVPATKMVVSLLPLLRTDAVSAPGLNPNTFLPASGVVDLLGLSPGPYTVNCYEPEASALPGFSFPATASAGGVLGVSVWNISRGLLLKVIHN